MSFAVVPSLLACAARTAIFVDRAWQAEQVAKSVNGQLHRLITEARHFAAVLYGLLLRDGGYEDAKKSSSESLSWLCSLRLCYLLHVR